MDVVGSIVGSLIGADAAESAAETQAGAVRDASKVQKDIFDKQVELQEPWRQAGLNALQQLQLRLGMFGGSDPVTRDFLRDFTMDDFQQDPGYAFRQSEGLKALQRGASARGTMNSGRSMKDILRFSQGLASQEYGDAFNRYQTQKTGRFNRLASIAGLGQTAANQVGADAGAYGSRLSDLTTQAGNASAAGRIGAANAITGGIGQGISAYQNNKLMERLFAPKIGSPYAGQVPDDYGAYL